LGSTSRLDLSRVALAAKQRLVPAEAKVVGISRWLAAQAMKSPVFNAHEISTISNCISTRDYFPVDKAVAKSLLTLTSKKKIILVGAQALATYYKGFDYFLQSLNFLDREKYHLCFFGALDPNEIAHLDFSYTIFGFLHDTISLRLAYSAADVFVAPSIMEAFGKTLAEAMACGTPVVCFDSTGPRDIVDHLENGYKAVSYEPADLARGVEWACFHQEPEKLGSSARQKVVASFDSEVIARKYIDVYKDALGLI
jgi:glycosyltransferase involved in cell wall biosynthesis